MSEAPKIPVPDIHDIANAEFTREFKVVFKGGGAYDGREGVLPFLPAFISLDNFDWWRDAKALAQGRYKPVFSWSKDVYMLRIPDNRPEESDDPFEYVYTSAVDFDRYLKP